MTSKMIESAATKLKKNKNSKISVIQMYFKNGYIEA